jgi:peptide chain release factor 2
MRRISRMYFFDKMKESNLKIEIIHPKERGGQRVGVDTPNIRVTHLPTGITATCGFERSNYKNKQVCIEMIEWALAKLEVKDENCGTFGYP